MKNVLVFAATLALGFGTLANATEVGQNAGGTLALTGTVEGSILLTFHNYTSGGITLTGDGFATASAALTTVSMYGLSDGSFSAGANFVKATQAGVGFTMTGTYDVKVEKANVTSANFDLKAALQSADTNYGWKVNTVTLSTTPQTVNTTGTYAAQNLQTLVINVPNTAAATAVDNTILYSVVVN